MNNGHEFVGKWITHPDFAENVPQNVFHRQLEPLKLETTGRQNSHILFRKTFTASKSSATLYISADDYYKLYVNGRFVAAGPAPGYRFCYYYNKINIGEYLVNGENTIALHTYYQGLINRVWVSGDLCHGLILDLEQDGKTIVASDETFACAYHDGFEAMGKVGYDTGFTERYYSSASCVGFQEVQFDSSGWICAKVSANCDYSLTEQPTKMLEYDIVRPRLTSKDGAALADFGAVYVGYLLATVKGKHGDVATVKLGQELDQDGNVRYKLRANCTYFEEWVLSGKTDTLDQFDYKSFRFALLELPDGCVVEDICLVARHYPFKLAKTPNVDHPDLLKIWDLCVNSLKYGVQEVIQDCMEREKGNYLGDGCYSALAYTLVTGQSEMFKKLIDDSLRSSFINGGLVTCACCSFMQEIAEYPLMMFYSLWCYYEITGDKIYLEEKYDALCQLLNFYKEKYASQSGLLCNLDKWCVVEWPANYRDGYDAEIREGRVCTDMHNVINAHYIGALKYMNKISRLVGKCDFAQIEPLEKAYVDAFFDKKMRLFRDRIDSEHISMVSNVFAYMYELFPDKQSDDGALEYFRDRGLTTVMLFGAYPLLEGLFRRGKKEDVYRFMLDKGAWLRMLDEGATTTFEGWGKDSKWNTSLFHLTLTYAVMFLCERNVVDDIKADE